MRAQMSSTTAASSFPGRDGFATQSIATRLRATVTIQPPGLSGTPSRGQVRSASAKASWTASSATVRSPDQRASAATAGPHSRRKTPSRLVIQRRYSPETPASWRTSTADGRDHRRDLDRLVAVAGTQEVEAVGDFGTLDVRAVGERPSRRRAPAPSSRSSADAAARRRGCDRLRPCRIRRAGRRRPPTPAVPGVTDAVGRLEQQRQPVVAHRRGGCAPVHHRPDLDAAVPRGRDLPGELQRVVEVVGLEHVVAAGHLGALGERAVGDGRRVGAAGDARTRSLPGPARRRRGWPTRLARGTPGRRSSRGPVVGGEVDVRD